ncbi:MAG: VanW family protein [Clostridia bacterium]|nr:VanW family protein [Clostridia bacterium]
MQNKPRRRAPASQRRRERKQRIEIIKYALLAVAVFIAVYFVQLQIDLRFGADVFYAGTYVNGIALEGKTYEQAKQELSELSGSVLGGTSFRLTYGEREWFISTADIGARLDVDEILDQAWAYAREGSASQRRSQIRALRTNPIVLVSHLEYDQQALRDFVYAIKEEIDIPAVNASVAVMGFEQLSVSQSQTGYELDAEALITRLIEAMTIGGNFDIALEPTVTEPEYTTAELTQATQCITRIATPTTASSSKRTANIRTALNNFNGMCVQPGQQISFNAVVGERSPERGYNDAVEYSGTDKTEGFGGGVCQASSTLYANLVYAGLQIDERHCHTMTGDYTKPSLDAAVNNLSSEHAKDLVFTNNTQYPVYIFTSVNDERAYVSIFGMPPQYEIEIVSEVLERGIKAKTVEYKKDNSSSYVYYTDEQIMAYEGRDGMRSQAWRYFKKDGQIVTQERLSIDYYQAQPDVYWVGVHTRSAG